MNACLRQMLALLVVGTLISIGVTCAAAPAPTVTATVLSMIDAVTVEVRVTSVTGVSSLTAGDAIAVRLKGVESMDAETAEQMISSYGESIVGRTIYLEVDPQANSDRESGEPWIADVYLDPAGSTSVARMMTTYGMARASASSTQSATASASSASASSSGSEASQVQETTVQASQNACVEPSGCRDGWCCASTADCCQPRRCYCAPSPSACSCGNVRVTRMSCDVRDGDYAVLEAKTVPGAWCELSAEYLPGTAEDIAPTMRIAFFGLVRWRWKVPSGTPEGRWPVTVSAWRNGRLIGRQEVELCVVN